MANNLTGNPWIIDTPGAGLLVSGDVDVKMLRWVGATTAGHQAIAQNGLSQVEWEDVAAGANYSTSEEGPFFFAQGLKVTTLASGKLYIYV